MLQSIQLSDATKLSECLALTPLRRFRMCRSLFFSVLTALLFLLPGQTIAEEKAPHKIDGLVLGDQITNYLDLVRMETAIPIRDQKYLRIASLRDQVGYRSGTVAFGSCSGTGRIVRIKLNYENSDKEFYEALLARFKKRFGEPDEWRGDPFHVIIAWKWSFQDKNDNRISLTLQHSRDEDYKWGNSVKLTNTTLVEEEEACYKRKHPSKTGDHENESSLKTSKMKEKDYQQFIPE